MPVSSSSGPQFQAVHSGESERSLPVIPTSLVEVDVVTRRRDGLPTATPVYAGDSGADLASAARSWSVPESLLNAAGATSAVGSVTSLPLPDERLGWTVGVEAGRPDQWRSAGAALVRAVRERLQAASVDESDPADLGEALDAEYVQVELPDTADAELVSEVTLGLALGDYRFRVTGESPKPRLRKALLLVPDSVEVEPLRQAAARAREWATATALARDLANAPSNIKDPDWLTGTAAQLAESVPNLSATVRDEKWLAAHGFGGVLAVGGGSSRPPRLLELQWRPQGMKSAPHVVLVGKGITFDTGGISIKPAEGMHLMRTDMAGGGAVIAAMLSIARLDLPVRVTAFVPAAENHVSGSSYRPGDVVRHYGGRTTEVTNTDAEGRMVLADALAYGIEQHDPDLVVDVATLTGAMKVALGLRTGGVFASDDAVAQQVRDAGDRVAEDWWPMPLIADHADEVHSEIADVRQCPPGPGGVMAAMFLREFTSERPWAHLDIAGPGRAERNYAEVVPGATGFAARTLIEIVAGMQ